MKTKLPERIASIYEAAQFLTVLHVNGESYHPEDDAHDIIWNMPADQLPNEQERSRLNKLMTDIYALPGNDGRHVEPMVFDPCAWLLDLDNEQEGVERCYKILGFEEWMTGGGCDALVKKLEDGNELWVTDDVNVPEKLTHPICVGIYPPATEEGQDAIGFKEYPNSLYFFMHIDEIINELRAQKLNEQ